MVSERSGEECYGGRGKKHEIRKGRGKEHEIRKKFKTKKKM